MTSHRIISVFGTRPEAIKMAPLVSAIEKSSELSSSVVVTAQHREMLDQVLDLFAIEPSYDLDIMKSRQTLSQITTNVLLRLDEIITELQPDLLLVHGDTTTTFSAALSAYYHQVPIGHVEAGLRTGDKYAPFPEEMNRALVGPLADLHFAPTDKAKNNLLSEGISSEKVFVTGNTVVDALKASVRENYSFQNQDLAVINLPTLNESGLYGQKLLTLEVHRRENRGVPMENIFLAVKKLLKDFPDLTVVFPVHRSPDVQEPAQRFFADENRVILTDPLPTRDFHNLIARSTVILTDSGGIQEEAPSFGVPVLVTREKTEREEGLQQGTVILTGTSESRVYQNTKQLLSDERSYRAMRDRQNPYGDGHASDRIVSAIEYFLGVRKMRPSDYEISPV